ncbi:hypothetical protein [Vibrio kanaloae]|uniref:hypothetical protein n=1 Tax=Vibrio kanaloae TaxID=170673 RepID=UPI000988B9F3|nr:hypothetical protein [Vibrio kanaloae]QPK06301.1 hypothetical protein BTD91_20690 [Vibrio kanaloae]
MLIPFGMKDDKLFDVSEVERGRACECICPSCKQPLRANKGDPEKKIHYFSHDPKSKKDGEKRKDCEYSFFVAARLLIKQRLQQMETIDILLPDGLSHISQRDIVGENHTSTCYYANAKTLTLCNIEIEKSYIGGEFDIVGYCGKHAIGLHFSYDGRLPLDSAVNDSDDAILEIDLTELLEVYRELKLEEGMTFIDVVLDYVLNSGERSWVNHPRRRLEETKVKSQLHQFINELNCWLFRKDEDGNDIIEQYYGQGGHYCHHCKRAWLDEHSLPKCPECSRSGRTFGRRAEIKTLSDLNTLRDKQICLKCFTCRTDEFEDICTECYSRYQKYEVKSAKRIAQEIVRNIVGERY